MSQKSFYFIFSLKELFIHGEELDFTRLSTNHIYNFYQRFGIEAARALIVKVFTPPFDFGREIAGNELPAIFLFKFSAFFLTSRVRVFPDVVSFTRCKNLV